MNHIQESAGRNQRLFGTPWKKAQDMDVIFNLRKRPLHQTEQVLKLLFFNIVRERSFHLFKFTQLSIFKNLFIFGCAGSLLLCRFSPSFGVQALIAAASLVAERGL